MQKNTKPIEKPRADFYRPELTLLPELTEERLRYRKKWATLSRIFIKLFARAEYYGLENFPDKGPGLIVSNHLGDLDMILGLSILPMQTDAVGTIDLYDHPTVGKWLQGYGMIWIHRGTPDRKAIRVVLQGLADGRIIAIAPEGRQSVTGSLEEGTGGAAFIALKAGVPIIPIGLTGTEDTYVRQHFRRLRRPKMTLRIGKPFFLDDIPKGREGVNLATDKIMRAIAKLLPEKYRGVYENSEN